MEKTVKEKLDALDEEYGLKEESLSDKIFKNKSIWEGEGYFFLSIEDVKETVKKLKELNNSMKTDILIDKLFGDKLI